REGDGGRGALVSVEFQPLLAVGQVPELDLPVAAGGRDGQMIRGHGERADVVLVSLDAHDLAEAGRVEDAEVAGGVAGGERLAVGREHDGADGALVAGQPGPLLAARCLPELHADIFAGRCQRHAVRGESEPRYYARMAGQRDELLAGGV